jgi:hypothetical protein
VVRLNGAFGTPPVTHVAAACGWPAAWSRTVIELLDDLTDITPARHVRLTPAATDPSAAAHHAGDLHARLTDSVTALADEAGNVSGWPPVEQESRSWRTATVADLARGSALTAYRAARAGQDRELPAGHTGRTVRDMTVGTRASGSAEDRALPHAVLIEAGDVLLPGVGGRPVTARVADEQDAGSLLGFNIHLFRPDPERLDPWFLAGFPAAKDNISSASAARRATDLAAETSDLLTTGLTSGALLPADTDTV